MVVEGLFGKLKELLKRGRESFLVIEDLGYGFALSRAKIRNKDKKIEIYKTGLAENFEEIRKSLFPVDKAILAVGSNKAITVESVICLKRNEPDRPVGEAELDTLLFRGLWEFLNRYRGVVSKKLGCPDSDLILSGAEIREVAVGASRVFNPLGFKGANLNFRYRGTFIRRELKALVERMENWAREKILVEGGAVIALSVPQPFDYFVIIRDKHTDIFAGGEGERLHFKALSWGSGRIVGSVASVFGVEPDVARAILLSLDEKPPARKIRAAAEKAIKEETENFLKLIPKSAGHARQSVFYSSPDLPLHHLRKFFGSRLKLFDFGDSLTKQGYDVIMSDDATLAFITHVYFPPQYRFLNELLARRARWLTAKS